MSKRHAVLAEPTDLARVQHVLAQAYVLVTTDVEIEEIGQDPFLIAAALGGTDRIVVTREASKPSAQKIELGEFQMCVQYLLLQR